MAKLPFSRDMTEKKHILELYQRGQFARKSIEFRICLHTIKICLKSAKGKFPTFIASCHSSQQTLLAMIILSLKEDCCVKRFFSSLFVLHCSDCNVICFMLRCDGDVKGIGKNRKLLKKKKYTGTNIKLSSFILECGRKLCKDKIQNKQQDLCLLNSAFVPINKKQRCSVVVPVTHSHLSRYIIGRSHRFLCSVVVP